jgi:D-xylonolactonase
MDDGETEPHGALYCWDRSAAPIACDQGFVISNGPAFSPDGRTLYHTDSVRRTINRFDVASDGFLSGKRPFIEIEEGAGCPDGTSVDAEGCLWVALYRGWAVRRYSPRGELLEVVALPCANVTKLALGGGDLKTAFVTTARKGLGPRELAAQPLAGNLFAFDAEVPGLATFHLHA